MQRSPVAFVRARESAGKGTCDVGVLRSVAGDPDWIG